MGKSPEIYLGALLYCVGNPWLSGSSGRVLQYCKQGALVVGPDGLILASGAASDLLPRYPRAVIHDHHGKLIIPGLIDLHLHSSQVDIIGSPSSAGLLSWLTEHTFPHEERFADDTYARGAALAFCRELIANGTTSAVIFSSSHESATAILAATAEELGLRSVLGKCSMDRNAPAALLEDAATDLAATARLIARWHRYPGLCRYALTPRFVPTCSDQLMAQLGALLRERPDLYVQTHHSETLEEVAWVKDLCPSDNDYLAVYERHGLVRRRTILAHAIHASDDELCRIAKHGAAIAHCPTSNLFLGSGLFGFARAARYGIPVGLGTDVGGGTSFSLWQTMNEAYKVSMLVGEALTPAQLFYAATCGGAAALDRPDLGSLGAGQCADFVILDPEASRLLARRTLLQCSPEDIAFALMHHADDRTTSAVYVNGRLVTPSDLRPKTGANI